ncbi:MAG: bifunctional 4-hydroxy-2-oxoglutarate aldolase/2-dehydro-3-deoxy-phosphogluconate aldolase [Ignavibacteriae bacterium]|nr:bifunctional 4-hydroxy-2-oxoglutarate aldolase/2-dehydro-3-deoxy-phosphogluconate aldolase [Ignavibacteriota bacterium]MCB9215239.1 bifunctional 4-hydroxy-2-oxoglutarate aldolase/2-dehydro-3-deoxy-phosphogluconate aldolase [Ignavibacteria bacterium]
MSQKERIHKRIVESRIIAVIREKNPDNVPQLIEGLRDAGITSIEITLTTPDAVELIGYYAKQEDLLVGVGSLFHLDDAQQAFAAGAQFYASPCLDPLLIATAHEADCVAIPGGLTPNELYTAWKLGADLVKVFPMPENGEAYLRSLLGPMPNLPLAPSGGITDRTGGKLLQAGATVLNVGSWLTPMRETVEHRVEETRRRGKLLVENVQQWKDNQG